jgi:hypothetical protein
MSFRNRLIVVLALAVGPLWSQVDSPGAAPAGGSPFWTRVESSDSEPAEEPAMFIPSPVSDEGYSLAFAGETPRTNYLRGGLSFGTAYDDNAVPSSGQAVGEAKYYILPTLSLQQTRPRVSFTLSYSPGYTFHQRVTSLNGIDHSLAIGFESRLSPHVTLKVSDSFQRTSDLLSLADLGVSPGGPGGPNGPSDPIVPPAANRISNFGQAEITYQFAQNAMIGAKSTLSGLWYPNRANIDGLFDATAGSGAVFYAHRLSGRHYIGATYQYQRLLTHPGQGETQTQSTLFSYTLYLPPNLSLSFFAGPEHSATQGLFLVPFRRWSPAVGGSLAWHGERTSLVTGYARRVGDGGGLSGAVLSHRADASMLWQMARTLTGGIGASYSSKSLLGAEQSLGAEGHTWSGSASIQHPLGQNLSVQLGYTYLHQSYGSVSVISDALDRNYVSISLTYQFERPLGR